MVMDMIMIMIIVSSETSYAILCQMAERRALCSAKDRDPGVGASVFGGIAKLLGGSGTTKHLKPGK